MPSTNIDVAFDRALLTPEYLADPYPFYRELREKAPFYFSERLNAWVATRYSDVLTGLLDRRLISGQRVESFYRRLQPDEQQEMHPLFAHLEKWIGNMDPPDHTRLRSLVNNVFTPKMVQDLAVSIETITARLLDAAEAKGEIDFVREFAYPLPATVIAAMLGVSPEDQEHFIQWANDLTAYSGSGSPNPELGRRALRSACDVTEYFLKVASDRRAHPRNDLISTLVALEDAEGKLSEQELSSMCTFLLVAGHETTVSLLSNGLLALFRHPAQCEQLREYPELSRSAVEEFLRYDSPIQHQTRTAAFPFEIAGTRVKKGQRVLLFLGAANRDPAQFSDPDGLDLARNPNKHVAFGMGIHYCLGAPLARLEAQIAFPEILRRFPRLQLADQSLRWRVDTAIRNPAHMQVTW